MQSVPLSASGLHEDVRTRIPNPPPPHAHLLRPQLLLPPRLRLASGRPPQLPGGRLPGPRVATDAAGKGGREQRGTWLTSSFTQHGRKCLKVCCKVSSEWGACGGEAPGSSNMGMQERGGSSAGLWTAGGPAPRLRARTPHLFPHMVTLPLKYLKKSSHVIQKAPSRRWPWPCCRPSPSVSLRCPNASPTCIGQRRQGRTRSDVYHVWIWYQTCTYIL